MDKDPHLFDFVWQKTFYGEWWGCIIGCTHWASVPWFAGEFPHLVRWLSHLRCQFLGNIPVPCLITGGSVEPIAMFDYQRVCHEIWKINHGVCGWNIFHIFHISWHDVAQKTVFISWGFLSNMNNSRSPPHVGKVSVAPCYEQKRFLDIHSSHCDVTGIMLRIRGIIPEKPYFRWVNYDHLPIYV